MDDLRGRALRDLRISITDRCNFRCGYCMPREHFGADHVFMEESRLLSFDQIETVARAAASVGVRKIRLTGGEPLLRRGVADLVGRLTRIDGLDVAMTTNGTLLGSLAGTLAQHGLRRVTVSLDALDPALFARMSDTRVGVDRVLAGIDAAIDAGMGVKLNMVVRRGMNEHEVARVAAHFRSTPVVVRFIEYMDVGATNAWALDEVVPADEILALVGSAHPLVAVAPTVLGEVATRYRYADGSGEIGVISSVTKPFCGDCTRLRLSADGRLHTCLFTTVGHDLGTLLRAGAGHDDVVQVLGDLWAVRDDAYSERRSTPGPTVETAGTSGSRFEMSYLGG
jgi:cyclic pyranopterin phosphate synthase